LDECFGSDTSKWDGSSVSDFETKAKDAVISGRGSSAQRQSGVDYCRDQKRCEDRSSGGSSQVGMSQLIDALYSMTTSVNSRNTRSLSKEDRFNGDLVKYRRFIRQFESYVLRGVHKPADKLDLLISSCTSEPANASQIV